jgi:hypothetical protein
VAAAAPSSSANTTAQMPFTPSHVAGAPSSSATVALQNEHHRDATSMPSLMPPTGAAGAGASLMEVSAFMTEQLKAQLLQQREFDKEQHNEMMRLMQAQKDEIKELRDEATEVRLRAVQAESNAKVQTAAAVSEAMARAALQMRIETVHAAVRKRRLARHFPPKHNDYLPRQARDTHGNNCNRCFPQGLLSDDERDAVEDAIADSSANDDVGSESSAVPQMIALSGKFLVDRAFARQLRRKYA